MSWTEVGLAYTLFAFIAAGSAYLIWIAWGNRPALFFFIVALIVLGALHLT